MCNCPALVIIGKCFTVIHNGFDLRDGVKGLARMHLNINVATWFKACAKFRHGAANSLCDPSDTPMIFGEQSDDAIGFA
jgi:hypothetical protein